MKKRMLSLLLVLVMVLGMFPVTAMATEEEPTPPEIVETEALPMEEETEPPALEPAAPAEEVTLLADSLPVLLGVNVILADILDTSNGWLPNPVVKSAVFEPGTGTASVNFSNSVLYTNGSFSTPAASKGAGGKYYFYITVTSLPEYNPVDYSKISVDHINVTMYEYEVDFLYAQDYVEGALTGKKFCFTATHNPAPKVMFGSVELKDGYYLQSGTPVISTNKPSGGYAYYKDGVLELNNYNSSSFSGLVLWDLESINIRVVGSNVLSKIEERYTSVNTQKYTDIAFTGDGSLTVKSNTANCVKTTGDVTVKGGNLTFGGGNALSGLSAASLTVNGGELVLQGTTSAINSGCTVDAAPIYVDENNTLWDGETDLSTYKYLRLDVYYVYVGGVKMYDGDYLAVGATTTQTTKPSGGYAYYNDGTLTLNNYSYEGKGYLYDSEEGYYATVYANQDLTVELVGTNSLKQTASVSNGIYVGVDDSKEKLTIQGDGSLNVTGTFKGIAARGAVTVNGGTIISTATDGGKFYSISICSERESVIINGGNVTVSGDYGLYPLNGYCEIYGGTVTATGIERAIRYNSSYGFTVAEGMNIQASTTVDGALGEYVAANHDSYKKIVIAPAPEVYVGGVGMYDGDYLAVGATAITTTKPSGGYAYYKNGTLTLNNYSYEGKGYLYQSILGDDYAVIYSKKDLTLELIGNNTLNQTDSDSEMIYVDGANLTVGGDGKLTGTSRGYALRADKDITINGGTVEVSAYSTSILSWGDVIINGGDIVAESVDRMGIYANDITINGGDVTAIGGNKAIQYDLSDGFSVAEGMKIQASTTVDGELGEYVAENHNSYKKIVVRSAPEVYVGGVRMSDSDYLAVGATATQTTKPSGGYAYYRDGKLTLNNYSYAGGGYGFGTVYTNVTDLTIELLGDNTLVQTKSGRDAICADGANLTIGGTGNLTCRGEDHGIWVGGGLTINGGTITAIGSTKAIHYNYGCTVAEDLTIQASTTADGELGEYVSANHDSYKKIVITPSSADEVPLRDKITQMMMVDFRYWDENLEDSVSRTGFTVMNDQVRKIVEDNNFGAVILFSNNIQDTEQIFNLTKGFQEAAAKNGGTPLMIATDQEGGSVYRLGTGTALPGNMALGATYATHGTKYAKEAGKIIGSELSALGINTNFAPVLDVNNNANNPVIGLRSYSDHAVMVGELAAAEIEGMAQYNLIGCAKHFPGHGDTATDSTYGLPLVNKALSVLEQNELKPYEVAIEKGVDMIMTAHILYPQLESDKILSSKTGKAASLPATMSDDILTDLLKVNMGFEGIIVTDAMNMAGITANWDTLQSCVIAINAGVDMLCMPVSLYDMEDYAELVTIIDGIEAAVKKGDIPMSRINDAYNRIMKVKENRGILSYNADEYTLEKANAVVGCEANREMEREISAAAVTVIKNENNVLPLKLTGNSKVLMLVPYSNESGQMIMAWNRAKQAGLIPDGAEVDYFCFNSATISADLKAKLDWADTYIIISEISSTARMEGKHWLSAAPYAFCDYAEENGKIAIISSVDKPYDVQSYPKADAIVAAYGCKGSSVDPAEALKDGLTSSEAAYGPNIIAAVEVILGTYGAQGKLPLDIPVYDEESNCYLNEISYDRGYGLTYDAKKEMKIYVGGVGMYDGDYLAVGATTTQTTKPSGGYAYYKDGTLTLNNYSYEGEGYKYGSVYARGTNLTIELLGDNTLVQTQSGRDAICTESANLTIGGTGNLTCRGEDHGIWVGMGLTINGGTITAIGSTMAIRYNSSYDCTVAEGLTIQASTTADGALGEYVAANHDSYKKIVIAPAITLTGSATDGIKVKVEKLSGSATLIVAQYEGGRMVDVQMQTVSADNTYTMNELTHKTGCTYKAFLVNSTTYAPLCSADDF